MNRSWPYPQKSSENQNRGTKRSRPIDKKVENNHSNDQKNDENDEDIDVPLSVGLAKFKAHLKAYLTRPLHHSHQKPFPIPIMSEKNGIFERSYHLF